MRRLGLKPVPALMIVATLAAEACAIALSWGLEPRYDTLVYVVFSTAVTGAGALIASRHPRNPIGWLLSGLGLFNALAADAAQGWGLRAAVNGWPGGVAAEWIATASWLPQAILLILTFLMFPNGRVLSRGWWSVAWIGTVGVIVAETGWSLDPDTGSEFVAGTNPLAVETLRTDLMFTVGLALLAAAMAASLMSIVIRFRRSSGVERQQLKWFAYAGAFAVVTLPLGAVLWDRTPMVRLLIPLALVALPASICVAILRYRLYDIDLLVSRTIAYGTLSVILAAAYAATVLMVGIVAGRGSAWATAGGTLVAAALFRPVRDRVQARVDSRFRRARYDALRQVAAFLEALRAGRAAPEGIEAVLREALDDQRLELRFRLDEYEPCVDLRGRAIADPDDDGRERLPITRGDVVLGWVVRDAGTPQQRALLRSLIDAAGLAIEVTRLRVELRRRLHEVAASRARIVAAADDERRRIERDLHDGAQQRLVSIGLALRHVQHQLGATAPEAGRSLDDAVAEITVAIDEMRELARGLQPAHLEAGLGPAFRELASRATVPVDVSATGERFAPDVETAAYFVACEALTNAVKHARASRVQLSVAREAANLVVSVADDGIGGAQPRTGSGLAGLSDRVNARGGTLRIVSATGRGTKVTAELPCAS